MYAIIRTGGKQYKVAEGDTIRVEKLAEEVGSTIKFNEVLMVSADGVRIGRPFIEGAAVEAQVVVQGRERKIVVFHKLRRKGFQKKQGHRQPYTALKITSITV